MNAKPAGGYNVNNLAPEQIKSHSSWLTNERTAILFYLLDSYSMEFHTYGTLESMKKVHSTLWQIYKNFRMLLRFNPIARMSLNLETQEDGVYSTDVAFDMMDKMIDYCETDGYTTKRLYVIGKELDRVEMMIRDILQYFHYFYRPDFRQKPDIEIATESYKQISDSRTVDELRAIVGKKHQIDFDSLSSNPMAMQQKYLSEQKQREDAEEAPEDYKDDDIEEEDVDKLPEIVEEEDDAEA